ncbi:hypothetical protein TELCIR_17486 [Teladorsagia circumcincta]|uniref:BPTI/Kunitz inhibitor domain-containing protein n=1 Tax=Teladorsagia circumcincta TaxID=45464 RepID=A0A2G9TSV1_TELCI|nr:hypothetical protein TELCIR_17486 [Teladorsagia circumcincta]
MYSGCGGNANNFESASRCRFSCGFADRISCPGDVPHTGSCSGKSCPKGSSCHRGAHGGGKCCDDAISKKAENFDCGNKKVIKVSFYQ